MSKVMKEFLNKLKNWKENFEINEYKNDSGNISQITTMLREKNITGLLALWDKKLKQDYFELTHPEYPEIISRAIYNIQHNMANFIFMVDKDNKYPWIIGQCESFINIIITKNNIFTVSNANHNAIYLNIKKLQELDSDLLKYSNKKFGFLLGQIRPYHFFYDHFKYLCEFNRNIKSKEMKQISQDKAFYKYGDKSINSDNTVYLFPAINSNNQNDDKIKQLNEQMEKYVYKDALKDFNPITHSSDTLKLWYGITGQKRSWLEQIEGCENIVLKLLEYYPKIELIIDGMTATEGEVIKNEEDEKVYSQIAKKLEGKCKITSLIGKDYRHKIQVCSTTDIFIANAGTGCIVPLRFCKKAGVLHSNSKLMTFRDTYPDTIKFFDKKYEIDVPDPKMERGDFCSYHIPWQHIFNLASEVLNQTKGTNIKLLDVPLVKEIAKEYKLQELEKNKFIIPFENIKNKIKANSQSADILREVALAFEKSGDITTAKTIMQKALMLRPNGPFIKKKLEEYKKILGEKK